MVNAYYLVTAEQIEQASLCAVTEGLPHQLFQIRYNNDNTKAIVQAEWKETPPGIFLGNYINGSAEQNIYNELAKPEWQTPMEEY